MTIVVYVKINYSLKCQPLCFLLPKCLPIDLGNYQVHFLIGHFFSWSECNKAEEEIHKVVPGQFLQGFVGPFKVLVHFLKHD